MAGLARQAVVLTVARIANYGLMFLSPVLLVRLLSVAEFGRYREFILYASLLQSIAAFSINESLLYFVPSHRSSTWRIIRQAMRLTAISSLLVVSIVAAADFASGRTVVGDHLAPLLIYTLLFVNLDFWEWYWLATSRTFAVLLYTVARLACRMIVVVGVAALTSDVETIIWSLCLLELLRIIGSFVAWRRLDTSRHELPVTGLLREQLRFCVPAGLAAVVFMLNRNIGNIAVARALGAAALAHYTIGLYAEPIVLALRNSVSTVLLPAMVDARRRAEAEALQLWQRSVVINCILLFPVVAILVRYAEDIIVTVFGKDYVPGAPVLQIYCLVMIRECFDFSPPLRVINRTTALVFSNIAALLTTLVSLGFLIPRAGLTGAVIALVIASYVDALWLGWNVARRYRVSAAALLPWSRIAKVVLVAVCCFPVLATTLWTAQLGAAGVVLAAAVYAACFVALLNQLKVPEMGSLLAILRRATALMARRLSAKSVE